VTRRRRRDERGFVALELVLGVGLLLIPVALLVMTIPTWSERQATARAIVREVARSTAVAGICDTGTADGLTDTMAANLGIDPAQVHVSLDCLSGQRLPRDGEVTAEVTVQMPAIQVPGITNVPGWRWAAQHREPVDPYRSFE
jgi:hypothetical protein